MNCILIELKIHDIVLNGIAQTWTSLIGQLSEMLPQEVRVVRVLGVRLRESGVIAIRRSAHGGHVVFLFYKGVVRRKGDGVARDIWEGVRGT